MKDEYIAGYVAQRNGEPMDSTKSDTWQAGWSDAVFTYLYP